MNLDELPQIKRFGLAKFPKDNLLQFALYLEGLYNLKVRVDKDKAIEKFIESLKITSTHNNQLSRRTLLRLYELFTEKI